MRPEHPQAEELDWRANASPELAVDARTLQAERLSAQACESGRMRELLYFHAALKQTERLAALRNQAEPWDTILCDLFLEADRLSTMDWIGQLDGRAEPGLLYAAATYCLKRNDTDAVVRLVNLGLEGGGRDVAVLNLLARFLANQRRATAACRAAAMSLQVNEYQDDIQKLHTALAAGNPPEFDLHLAPAPRYWPVTVCLLVTRPWPELETAIEAVLCQSYPVEEILVIDDCPGNGIERTVGRFPVRILRHQEPAGIAGARQTGLCGARTPFVAFLEPEVFPGPEYLCYAMLEFEQSGSSVAAVGGRLLELNTSCPADQWRAVHLEQNPGDLRIHSPELLHSNNTVFRREAPLAAGGWCEHAELCARLKGTGHGLAYTPHAVAFHTRTDTLHTVLRREWEWTFSPRHKEGAWENAASVVRSGPTLLNLSRALLNKDIHRNLLGLAHIDFLLFFHDVLEDANHAVRVGVMPPAEARFVQETVLSAVEYLDDRFGGNLARHTGALCARVMQQAPQTAPCAEEPLRVLLAAMARMYDGVPEDLYRLLEQQAAETAARAPVT